MPFVLLVLMVMAVLEVLNDSVVEFTVMIEKQHIYGYIHRPVSILRYLPMKLLRYLPIKIS